MTTQTETPALDLLRLTNARGQYVHDEFYQSESERVLLLAGVGVGKTTLLAFDAFDYAISWPGCRQVFTEPTFDTIKDVLLPVLQELYGAGFGGQYTWTNSSPINVTFANGSVIMCRAADSVIEERRAGTTVSRVLMDEVTLGDQEHMFYQLAQRYRDQRFGVMQFKATGTPRGKNWAWKKFVNPESRLSDVKLLRATSMDAERCGIEPEGYCDRIAEQFGGYDTPMAKQELGGEFLDAAGLVFPEFRRDLHVKVWTPPPAGEPGFVRVVGGIDFGDVSPTAIYLAGLDRRNRLFVRDGTYRYESGIDDWIKTMVHFTELYKVTRWAADPAGKDSIQKLRNAGLNVTKARHGNRYDLRVPIMRARLHSQIDNQPTIFFDPSLTNCIGEFEGLMWARQRVGGGGDMLGSKFDRTTPDHAVDAVTDIVSLVDLADSGPVPQQTGPADRWVSS